MIETLKLYGYTFRSRAERIIWCLEELELPYQLVRLDPFKGDTRSTEFLALNPEAKIPVLLHGDRVLTETLAILEYVANLKPEAELIPATEPARSQFRQTMAYATTELEAYLWIADQATRLSGIYDWPTGTEAVVLERSVKALNRIYAWLQGKDFIIGAEFSLADIYIGHLLIWAEGYGIELPNHVSAYLSGLRARPACPYKKAG